MANSNMTVIEKTLLELYPNVKGKSRAMTFDKRLTVAVGDEILTATEANEALIDLVNVLNLS